MPSPRPSWAFHSAPAARPSWRATRSATCPACPWAPSGTAAWASASPTGRSSCSWLLTARSADSGSTYSAKLKKASPKGLQRDASSTSTLHLGSAAGKKGAEVAVLQHREQRSRQDQPLQRDVLSPLPAPWLPDAYGGEGRLPADGGRSGRPHHGLHGCTAWGGAPLTSKNWSMTRPSAKLRPPSMRCWITKGWTKTLMHWISGGLSSRHTQSSFSPHQPDFKG